MIIMRMQFELRNVPDYTCCIIIVRLSRSVDGRREGMYRRVTVTYRGDELGNAFIMRTLRDDTVTERPILG